MFEMETSFLVLYEVRSHFQKEKYQLYGARDKTVMIFLLQQSMQGEQ